MDTALAPLARGEVMYVPSAFSEDGLREIHARVAPKQRIELSDKDAAVFCANAVKIGDDIVMSSCSTALRHRLEAGGYRVHPTGLSAYHRSGGSAFCLTLRLDRQSAQASDALRHVS